MHRNTIGCKWIFKVKENEFGVSILHVCEEYAFTKALETCGFPVPNALEHNRHCVIMSLVQGYPLFQVKQLQNPDTVFETIIGIIIRLAENGIIHCDFNEFNIMEENSDNTVGIESELTNSLSKQRQCTIASSHRGQKSYKDKGGRSSHNSKFQMQMSSW